MPHGIDAAGFAEWAEAFYRSGNPLARFEREFLALAEARGWLHALPADSGLRRDRIAVLYKAVAAGLYSGQRHRQLIEAEFALWVYRTGTSIECADAHLHLDGLSLPPDHSFWHEAFPPNDWGCSCYVVGARSDAGARRLGGNPGRTVPAVAIPAAFRRAGGPPLEVALAAVLDGSAL